MKLANKCFQSIAFILSIVLHLLWLKGVSNFSSILIGRAFSFDEVKGLFSSSPVYIEIGLILLAIVFLLLSARSITIWKKYTLVILIVIEIGVIIYFIYRWFLLVWVKDSPTAFGLAYLFSLVIAVSVPLAVHIWILTRIWKKHYA